MTNSCSRCLKLPTESYERRLLLVEKKEVYLKVSNFANSYTGTHKLFLYNYFITIFIC